VPAAASAATCPTDAWSTVSAVSGSASIAAREGGVLLSPGDDYAASRATPAHGIRLGLNADVDDDRLREALLHVVALRAAGPLPGGLS
jgi:hypothetical protein